MKKFLTTLLLLIPLACFAELEEVRGVETKQVCEITETPRNTNTDDCWASFYMCFTNQNGFSVSIDANLFESGNEIDSKSFELAPKETYRWCIGGRTCYEPGGYVGKKLYYKSAKYVKFKAYKSKAIPY